MQRSNDRNIYFSVTAKYSGPKKYSDTKATLIQMHECFKCNKSSQFAFILKKQSTLKSTHFRKKKDFLGLKL